jgi:DNA replication and repair protein RecF
VLTPTAPDPREGHCVKILALQLTDWRNVPEAVVELHPHFNIFAGDNAQGKTNLLEAVHYLGTLRSYRATRTEELIRFGAAQARVRARIERSGVTRLLEVTLKPGHRSARLDGKAVRAAVDWFGSVNAVLFASEDLRLPKGSPGQRRRFLDRAIFGARPEYLKLAQTYEKILRSRNAILRAPPGGREPSHALLGTYNEQLVATGAQIVTARTEYLAQIYDRYVHAFEQVTRSGVKPGLRYTSEAPTADAFAGALRTSLRRDLARGFTTVGPHADDLELILDERPARLYGSQGQLRAIVLALKMAEIQHLEAELGEPPVLMLDDVSSELDPQRNRYLFEFIGEIACQCIITTTDRSHILLAKNRKDFRVLNGTFGSTE